MTTQEMKALVRKQIQRILTERKPTAQRVKMLRRSFYARSAANN